MTSPSPKSCPFCGVIPQVHTRTTVPLVECRTFDCALFACRIFATKWNRRELESRVSPGVAPETNNEPPDESYGNQVGKYGFIRTIGGSYMLVDETEEGRPLARFVNQSAAEEVGRFMARLEAKALLAPSSAPEEATPLRNAAKQAEYELSQIANIAKVSDYTRGRLREIAAMLADAHGESYKGASRSSGEDQTAAAPSSPTPTTTEPDTLGIFATEVAWAIQSLTEMADDGSRTDSERRLIRFASSLIKSATGPCTVDCPYPHAARVIHLHLAEFCDEDKPYPEMVADAARRAASEIASLKQQVIDSALRAERLEVEIAAACQALDAEEDDSLEDAVAGARKTFRNQLNAIADLRADRTALIEGKVWKANTYEPSTEGWRHSTKVKDGPSSLYATADEALAAYRASLPPQPAPKEQRIDPRAPRYRDGEPCSHRGCLNHVSHPCDGCGRIAGRAPQPAEPETPSHLCPRCGAACICAEGFDGDPCQHSRIGCKSVAPAEPERETTK